MSMIEDMLLEFGFNQEVIDGIFAKPGSSIPVVFLAGGYNIYEYHIKTGIPAYEIVKDPKHLLNSQIDLYNRFGIELLTCLVDLNIMSESFGAELYYELDGLPMPNRPAINSLDEVEELEIPDPQKDGRMPIILESAKLYQEKYKNKKEFVYGGVIEGPITAASNILGVENFMRGLAKQPELIHKLLAKVTESLIIFGNKQLENGVDAIGIAEPTASSTCISPRFFKEFAVPYLKKINRKLNTPGTLIHICGYTQPIIKDWIKITNTFIISVDDVDIKKTLETIGNKFVIVAGNIPTISLLRGTPSEIEQITKDIIQKVGNSGKFVLCPGCDLAPGTPEENIFAFIQAGKKYGIYPIKSD
ncbi:MAG: uroporphyrinogen decarboxylase family protein [Candidatus Helarchaeota archaeon]